MTPLVSGIVVVMIGLSLIRVAIVAMGGGSGAIADGTFATPQNLMVSLLVLSVIVVLNCTRSAFLRMSAILIGLVVGYLVALPLGMLDFSGISQLPYITVPIPFRYGFDFGFAGFIPLAFLYVITTIESIGDLTATSMLVGEPIEGKTLSQAGERRHFGRWGQLPDCRLLQHLPQHHFQPKQRGDSADRGGQPLCGLLHCRVSVCAGPVPHRRGAVSGHAPAGAGGSNPADV
jgi:hypothetical protein